MCAALLLKLIATMSLSDNHIVSLCHVSSGPQQLA